MKPVGKTSFWCRISCRRIRDVPWRMQWSWPDFLRDLGYMPEQVQDFYPTPATVSTCMYYTGLDPRTMQPVYVEKNPHRKALAEGIDPVPAS